MLADIAIDGKGWTEEQFAIFQQEDWGHSSSTTKQNEALTKGGNTHVLPRIAQAMRFKLPEDDSMRKFIHKRS